MSQESVQIEEKSDPKPGGKLVVVRIRGIIGIKHEISRALDQLNLHKKNFCVVVPKNKSNLGMVMKAKDYVTWGDLDEHTYNLLLEKKGEEYKGRISDKKGKLRYNNYLTINDKKIKRYFRLNSPIKGYGRKGVKVPYTKGGALGYRADKINDLIVRMAR